MDEATRKAVCDELDWIAKLRMRLVEAQRFGLNDIVDGCLQDIGRRRLKIEALIREG